MHSLCYLISATAAVCLIAAACSPYVCRLYCAVFATWADSLEEWRDALARHWRRHGEGLGVLREARHE